MSCRDGAYRTTGATLPREAGNFSTVPTHAAATLNGGKRWVSTGQEMTESQRRGGQRTACIRITLVREPPRVVRRGGAHWPDIDTTENGRGGTSPAAGMRWVATNKNVLTRAPNGLCSTAFTLGRKWPAAVPETPRRSLGGGRTPRLDVGLS